MDVLQRLARSRALARLGGGPPPAAEPTGPRVGGWTEVATTTVETPPFVRVEHQLDLVRSQARSQARVASTDHPALLGGCLDRLALPAEPALAQALVCLGPLRGGARPVFLDTETTGLGGVALPFVVGLAWHEGARFKVTQWTLRRLGGEAELLTDVFACLTRLGPAPLVSFNGASFDVPLLRLRARRHGLCDAVLGAEHLDLLHPARRLCGPRAGGSSVDCRLGTLERDLLDVHRRGDIESADIPEVFWSSLRAPEDREAQRRLRAVCDHNLVDLVTLPALAERLAEQVRAPQDLAGARRSARHLLRMDAPGQARTLLARFVEGPELDPERAPAPVREPVRSDPMWADAALELATLERRAGAKDRAARLWQAAWRADRGCPSAAEAWAKHLEHHHHDFEAALAVARGSRQPCARRIARLERRAASADRRPDSGLSPAPDVASRPGPGPAASPIKVRARPAATLLHEVEDGAGVRLRYSLLR